VVRNPAAPASRTRSSSAARTSRIKVDAKAVPKKTRKDYHVSSASPVARLGPFPTRSPGSSRTWQDFKAARDDPRARRAAPRAQGEPAALQRLGVPEDPWLHRRRQEGQLPRGARQDRVAAIRGASRAIETELVRLAGVPEKSKLWEYVPATRRSTRTKTCRRSATAPRRWAAPGVKQIKATYGLCESTRMARIGPSCAVAEYVDGKLTSWSASQQTICCASRWRRC